MPSGPSALRRPRSSTAVRVGVAFWILGLINNVLYVIILSAALDLVGPSIPKGVVLLADVFPSFVTKLIAPYFIHLISYGTRVCILVALSTLGMLVIALTPATHDTGVIALKLLGVALASLSSGGGELSFIGLTHFYGHLSLAAWSSGTGGAGLVGAGAYVVATTSLGLSSRSSLLAFSFLPLIMLVSFFLILPIRPVSGTSPNAVQYQSLPAEDEDSRLENPVLEDGEADPLRGRVSPTLPAPHRSLLEQSKPQSKFQHNVQRAKGLFFPYMLPLLLVYIAEYTINQGVAPTLLFPLSDSPFSHFRDFYPTYGAIYQVGVFISRSSTPWIRVSNLYLPSILQVVNLVVLTLHALFNFLPSVWFVFIIIFWEGLLGGLVYVNTFAEISDNVPVADREFSLSATTVSDSGGICVAAFISMAFEKGLCNWQVSHGRDYCRRT